MREKNTRFLLISDLLCYFLNVRLGGDPGLVWKESVYSECCRLGLQYGLCAECLVLFSVGLS